MAEIPPRDSIEHSLQEIWEKLLGAPGIGIRTSFLAAGGDVAMAELMLERVEQLLEMRVPLAEFLEEPTIERLAAAVEGCDTGSLRVFSPATAGSATTGSLFVVSWGTLRLARAVGRLSHVHLLPWAAPDYPILASVEATAAACLRTLRRLQPVGPYRLAGFCLGSLIAYEMARRLEKEGELVEALILLAPRPWSHRWCTRRLFRPVARLLGLSAEREVEVFVRLTHRIPGWERRAQDWLARPPREKVVVVARKVGRGFRRLARRPATATVPPVPLAPLHPAVAARRKRQRAERTFYNRVHRAYVPGSYGGRVTILWPEEEACDRPGYPDEVWRKVAREVECLTVQGGHHSCLSRHVESLAVCLSECLRAAQDRSRSPSVSERPRATQPPTSPAASVSSSA